jgi:hypothetical protein
MLTLLSSPVTVRSTGHSKTVDRVSLVWGELEMGDLIDWGEMEGRKIGRRMG